MYIFADESGDWEFSKEKSKYLFFTSITTSTPLTSLIGELEKIKNEFLRQELEIKEFKASEDQQIVRDKVFDAIESLGNFKIYSVVVEKRKTHPVLQNVTGLFPVVYPALFKYILIVHSTNKATILIDELPQEKKHKNVVLQRIPLEVRTHLKLRDAKLQLYFHESKYHYSLQIVDYCNWAIYKKWVHNDIRPYNKINSKVQSIYEIFREGKEIYY